MKSVFVPGQNVQTNRIYKKRYGKILIGKVLKNTHFGRFVVLKTEDGEVSVKPEHLEPVSI